MSKEEDAPLTGKDHVIIAGATVFTLIVILAIFVIGCLLGVPADVTYEEHGTGRSIDIVMFEVHGSGVWSYDDWDHLPVDNVVIHHKGETHIYEGVTDFDDSYNPYICIDVCDEYHQFQFEKDDFYISGGPLAFSNYGYYEQNNTIEYHINDRFAFKETESGYIIY